MKLKLHHILSIFILLLFVSCNNSAISEQAEEQVENSTEEIVPTEESPPTEEAVSAEPVTVKIGVLNPTTGGLALFGEQSNQGIQLYFDNHEIEGVEVELVYADTAGDPQQALDQARRLVEQENVDFLMGLVNSAVSVPMAQYADESETPLLIRYCRGACRDRWYTPICVPHSYGKWPTRSSTRLVCGHRNG